MNCETCKELMIDYVEGLVDDSARCDMESHLKECPSCSADMREHAQLHARLTANGRHLAGISLETSIMTRIQRTPLPKSRRIAMLRKHKKAVVGIAAAAATLAVAVLAWMSFNSAEASAAEVLGQAIRAASNLRSVHIKANMRTAPRDNFELIGLQYDFVPHEMWKQFSDPPQWRIEKTGRVVIMDGQSSLLFIKPNYAVKGGVNTGFVEWLKPLLDVDQVLDSELQSAEKQGWELTLSHEMGPDAAPKLIVTIEAKAQGDFTHDWLKNKGISESDNRRVYRFDALTKLLEDLKVYVHTDKQDVLVFELTQIDYNPPIDPTLFALELPKNVTWLEEPKILPDSDKYQQMSPEETARAFFQACAKEDWDEVLKFWPMSAVDDQIKRYLGGLEIISIGTSFKSGLYPGWFVPYEIKFKNGETKKFNLAVRNDNPAKRYVVDGGI